MKFQILSYVLFTTLVSANVELRGLGLVSGNPDDIIVQGPSSRYMHSTGGQILKARDIPAVEETEDLMESDNEPLKGSLPEGLAEPNMRRCRFNCRSSRRCCRYAFCRRTPFCRRF